MMQTQNEASSHIISHGLWQMSWKGHSADSGATVQEMYALLDKYSRDLERRAPPVITHATHAPNKDVVLITDTTSTLGAALLAQLCEMAEVARVYAMNGRGTEPLVNRQRAALAERSHDANAVLTAKVTFVEAQVGQPYLGIGESLYCEIRDSLTHIVHNGEPPRRYAHRQGLQTDGHLRTQHGPLTLSRLYASSPRSTSSSTYVPLSISRSLRRVQRCPASYSSAQLASCTVRRPALEIHDRLPSLVSLAARAHLNALGTDPCAPVKEEYDDASVSVGDVDSQARWVAEQLLVRATPLPSLTIRIGQISGSDLNGAWNYKELSHG
ncbi:hypothetical protein BDW22DRAFT_845432 [Trametopsis cervina]|nr:hypothetical protein BDW22DRAFT_845432 [Trametopsis cervina]